jgi:hypothetical protein
MKNYLIIFSFFLSILSCTTRDGKENAGAQSSQDYPSNKDRDVSNDEFPSSLDSMQNDSLLNEAPNNEESNPQETIQGQTGNDQTGQGKKEY